MLALAGCAGTAPDRGGNGLPPADALALVEGLLALEPSAQPDPLAAMHAWAALYATYRDRTRAGDRAAARAWLLMAHAALVHADAGTSESFSGDLLPAYRAQPAPLLDAMAANAWLVPTACFYLGRHFDAEGRGGAGRAEFVDSQRAVLAAALPGSSAGRCLAQLQQPRRPWP